MKRVVVVFAAVLAFTALHAVNMAHAKPRVSWTGGGDLTIARGESASLEAAFSSSVSLSGVNIFVSPEIGQFLTVSPSEIPNVNPGVAVSLTFDINIPHSTPIGVYRGTVHVQTGARTHARPLEIVLRVGERVGSEGGEVTTPDGTVTLTIPEGAVSESLVITFEKLTALDLPASGFLTSVGPFYNIEPSGAVFAEPLILTFIYNPLDLPSDALESDLRLAYVREDGETVSLNSVVDVDANTVSAQVNHFTRFGVFSPPDLTPPSPPTNVAIQVNPSNLQQVTVSWANPAGDDFSHANVFRSSQAGVLSDVVDPVFGPQPIRTEVSLTSIVDLMDPGLNCYTVSSVDFSGNSANSNQICLDFTPTAPSITVDGDPSDWAGINPILTDAAPGFVSLTITDNGASVFLLLEYASPIDISAPSVPAIVFMNIDLNIGSGCASPQFLAGSDFAVRFGAGGAVSGFGDLVQIGQACGFNNFSISLNHVVSGRFIEAELPVAVLEALTPDFTGFGVVILSSGENPVGPAQYIIQ